MAMLILNQNCATHHTRRVGLLGPVVEAIAEAESLEAHRRVVSLRLASVDEA
ncbi:hypothetical protein GCM10027423_56210 [Spirosoma arcticum]